MKKFMIPLLTVIMLASIILVGCAPTPVERLPPGPEEQPPEAPSPNALPKAGVWSASTGYREFTFTFTVNLDGTGITEYSYEFTGFECEFEGGRTQVSGGVMAEIAHPRPITVGQFTLDWVERIDHGPDWNAIIQGRFDETGTHASGTWEINAEGTTCQEGTWEASAPTTAQVPTPTPTPAPTHPPSEPTTEPPPEVLFEDDFSDSISGWPRESMEERETNYKNGEYHVLMKEKGRAAWVWNWETGEFTDFTVEIDARLINGTGACAYGLVYRLCEDSENFYRFLVYGDGHYVVGAMLDGIWTELQSRTKSPYINEGSSTNHLKVYCRGYQIEVFANDHYLTTVMDDSFTEGYVGMIVDTPEADTLVAFDNIRVYSIEPTPEPEPVPPPEPAPTHSGLTVLSHSLNKVDGIPAVRIEVRNDSDSVIGCAKITVNFLDSDGEFLFSASEYKYNLELGQTYNYEVIPAVLETDDKIPDIYKQVADYEIEVDVLF